MFTPAIRASSTSAPSVINWKAFSTQVCVPPFLNLLPLFEATTTGFTLFGVIIVGACPRSVFGIAAAAAAAAVVAWTNSRRFTLINPRIQSSGYLVIWLSGYGYLVIQ